MEYIKVLLLIKMKYDAISKNSILCILGVGLTAAVCYAIHEKYYKSDGLKKDK